MKMQPMDLKRSFVAVDSAFLLQKTLGPLNLDAGSSLQATALEALQVPTEGSCTEQEYCFCLSYLSVEVIAAAAEIGTAYIAVGVECIAGYAGFELHKGLFAAGPSGAVGIVEGFELVDLGRSTLAVVVAGRSRFGAGMLVPAAAEHMDWWETYCPLD